MRQRASHRDRHSWSTFGTGLAGVLLTAGVLTGPVPAAEADGPESQKPALQEQSVPRNDEQQSVDRRADGQEKDSRKAGARKKDARKTGETEPGAPEASTTKIAAAPAAAADNADNDEPLRFTNDDLPTMPRMYRGNSEVTDETGKVGKIGRQPRRKSTSLSAGTTPATAGSPPPPGETTAQRRQQLRRQLTVLRERVRHLEARQLSMQNPLHRGVTPGREDEEKAVGGLSNETQLAWVKKQLATTKLDLKKTQAALSAL